MANTENSGIPRSIPIIPYALPNSVIANNTQSPDKPSDVPTTFGYIIFPSICCSISIKIIKHRADSGEFKKSINAPIPAPINAPNIGINAVIPINVLINTAKSKRNIVIPIKHNVPRIIASKSWPDTKFENVVFTNFPTCIKLSALF